MHPDTFLFSEETLGEMLKSAGFEIEGVTYDMGPKVEIRSLYLLLGKKDLRINPFVWRAVSPITKILSRIGHTSTMTIRARKISSQTNFF